MKRLSRSAAVGAVLMTVLCLALITATLLAQGKPAAPIPAPVTVSSGRWQVVNGVPDTVRTVMLLDTATGNTWIFCNGGPPDNTSEWCAMPRSNEPAGRAAK